MFSMFILWTIFDPLADVTPLLRCHAVTDCWKYLRNAAMYLKNLIHFSLSAQFICVFVKLMPCTLKSPQLPASGIWQSWIHVVTCEYIIVGVALNFLCSGLVNL